MVVFQTITSNDYQKSKICLNLKRFDILYRFRIKVPRIILVSCNVYIFLCDFT